MEEWFWTIGLGPALARLRGTGPPSGSGPPVVADEIPTKIGRRPSVRPSAPHRSIGPGLGRRHTHRGGQGEQNRHAAADARTWLRRDRHDRRVGGLAETLLTV